MTNSISSAKWSSLLVSGNYGMSQNRYTDDSKEYIFVKLTDSAYRAVEEYQRNENSHRFLHGQCAKIQFIGNSGVIHFPTPDSNDGGNNSGRQFGFAIDDVEGSLECIQQKQNELDVLGSLSYRMRIHANEDVYDTTRTKMAIAEETEKSKCIREIKPNQTDIGRKVKKPLSYNQHNTHGSSNSNNNVNRCKGVLNFNTNNTINNNAIGLGRSNMRIGSTTSMRSPHRSLINSSSSTNGNTIRYGVNNKSPNNTSLTLTSASSLSSALADGIANGYASALSSTAESVLAPKGSKLGGSPSACFRGIGSTEVSLHAVTRSSVGSGNNGNSGRDSSSPNGSKLPDISRRKIRERLIHLLALKPFKKPELYSRLQNEGLRERERPLISNILKDISTLRDNTYNLRRQIWNDVNENWPYYTEQELQVLKRRKPQNLTPPLSSDAGSSTSGQSPTSTHTGSPPPIVGNVIVDGSSRTSGGPKRNSMESNKYNDTLLSSVQHKKPRISHYRKEPLPIISGNCSSNIFQSSKPTSNLRGNNPTFLPTQSTMHATSDESFVDSDLSYSAMQNAEDFIAHLEPKNSYVHDTRKSCSATTSSTAKISNTCSDGTSSNRDIFRASYVPENALPSLHKSNNNYGNSDHLPRQSPNNHHVPGHADSPKILNRSNNSLHGGNKSKKAGGIDSTEFCSERVNITPNSIFYKKHSPTQPVMYCHQLHHNEPSNQHNEQLYLTPTQQIANATSTYTTPNSALATDKPQYDFSKYTPITTIEQRRQYKTEFESDYDEYLKLLKQIENVRKRFLGLAERLDNARQGCPEFNDIKQEIVSEYERICNADTLKRDKQRFDYLHEKLAYIKQLVTDYDKTLTGGSSIRTSGSSNSLFSPSTAVTSSFELEITNTRKNKQQKQDSQRLTHYDFHDSKLQNQRKQESSELEVNSSQIFGSDYQVHQGFHSINQGPYHISKVENDIRNAHKNDANTDGNNQLNSTTDSQCCNDDPDEFTDSNDNEDVDLYFNNYNEQYNNEY